MGVPDLCTPSEIISTCYDASQGQTPEILWQH